jgi:carnitine O-acetyltransferase
VGSWLLENTSKIFNIARIPEPFCDTLSEPPKLSSRAARSVLVMIHDWCYSVVVYQPPSLNNPNEPGELLSPGEIETRLRAVVVDVESRLSNGEKPLPVGVLSADERDRWAKVSSLPQNAKFHLR